MREVRLVQGGKVVRRFEPKQVEGVVHRLDINVTLPIDSDTWILAEAGESLDRPAADPGRLYRKLAPGFVPIAFTNPVFVDLEGDRMEPPTLRV